VNTLLFRRMEGQTEFHPQRITSTPGDKIYPSGTTSPPGSKFAPRGEVKNGPQEKEKQTLVPNLVALDGVDDEDARLLCDRDEEAEDHFVAHLKENTTCKDPTSATSF
jgi:hypothetical protein